MQQAASITYAASTQMQCQDEFASGSHRSPDPDALCILLDFGHQFIQLKMAHFYGLKEEPLMQPSAVLPPPRSNQRLMVVRW